MDKAKLELGKAQKIMFVLFALFVLVSVVRLGLFARDLVFHEDEYQHTHLAWNTSHGKVIYKDFEESHGPLSTLWYSAVLKLVTLDGELIQSFHRIRYVNIVCVVLTALILGLNIWVMTGNPLSFIAGAAAYLLTPSISSVAFRIRPDCYVALFSVLSLFFWLKEKKVWMGLCLGICLGFHAKFLPINLIILSVALLLLRKNKKEFFKILMGETMVLSAVFAWFGYHHAIPQAIDGMFKIGFKMAYKRFIAQGDVNRLFRSAQVTEFWLGFLVVSVLVILIIRFYKTRKFSLDPKWVMSGAYTLASFLFLLAPVWAHALVFVIPLGLTFLVSSLFIIPQFVNLLALCLLAGLSFLLFKDPRTKDKGQELQTVHFESLELALKETQRTEPIFYIWTSRCPAYVFNEDPSRFWMNHFKRTNPNQPIRQLPPIQYLSIHPAFLPAMDPQERAYIQEHFKLRGCFWKRIK